MRWHPSTQSDPDSPGVYAVYLDGRLAYIGSSDNVKRRLKDHSFGVAARVGVWRGMAFTDLSVKTRQCDCKLQALALESALIRRLRPCLNVAGNPTAKRTKVGELKVKLNPHFRRFVDELGGQAKAARLLKLSPSHVSLIYNGKRRVTAEIANQIHIASRGRYSREALVFNDRPSRKSME